MHKTIFFKLLAILTILSMTVSTTGAQTTVSWGVGLGDTAVYWIDNVQTSLLPGVNAAVLINDANRTQVMTVTAVENNYLNYTLALANATQIIPNQQVQILETSLAGQSVLLPNGSLPLVLPLSAADHSDYLAYLSTQLNLANSFLSSLLQGVNITATGAEISSVLTSSLLNISVSANLLDLSGITSGLLGGLNISDQLSLNQNQTINGVNFNAQVSYNTTDGMLSGFGINAALNTTSYDTNTNNETIATNNILTFNATIVRKSFIDASQLATDPAKLSSIAQKSPFYALAMLPAFLVLRKKRKLESSI